MDIEALRLLQGQRRSLRDLPDISNPQVTLDSYEKNVGKTMSNTKQVIERVSKYATSIREELEDVRELVQRCSIKIGEQIKELMKNYLLKGEVIRTDLKGIPITGKDIDQTKLKQVQTMQRLAEQQQKLMAFIAETENLALKVENDAALAYSDLAGMKNHLEQWSSSLETLEEKKRWIIEEEKRKKEEEERRRKEQEEREAEEKRKRQEEEKRKKEEEERRRKEQEEREAEEKRKRQEEEKRKKEEEERMRKEQEEREAEEKRKRQVEEKRKKEEEERRRKEQEEREAEEKRKRQEEEKKRRDWRNWPPFIYNNNRKNKFGHELCCVIFAYPDGITENDLHCESSDMGNELDKCIESNDEKIISSVISIKPRKAKSIEFKMPVRVYVPVVTHNQTLKPKLKFKMSGTKKWNTGKTLPTMNNKKFRGIIFVGVEIPVKKLEHLQCVAVARHRRDETNVDEYGKTFEPEGDRNIKVKFPEKSFPGQTTVAITTVPWTNEDIQNASKKHKELMNIKTAGSYINISCEKSTKKDTELNIYDFGWVVDKDLKKEQTIHQETLNRCSRWLVNHMTSSNLQEVFDSDFVDQIQAEETEGDKNRLVLRKLYESNDHEFDTFVDRLKSKQPNVADRITNVQAQVKLSRKSSQVSEDDFGNDFDQDFTMKEGTVNVVSKSTGKSWKVVPFEASDEHPNARFVKLPAGNNEFQVLGLVVPDGMAKEDICRAAEILEGLTFFTSVSVICRQKRANPHDVIIDCVRTEKVHDTLQHLDSLGYNDGPAESSEFGVVDGEEVEIRMEANLYLEEYKHSSLKFKFYKHLPLSRYSGNVGVLNKSDQVEGDKYHGYLTYNVVPGRLSLKRQGKMILYVPKPLEEMVGNFPYTVNVPVKALAKFIAWQLSKDNFNSTRWVKLAGYLTLEDKRVYHDIIKHIDEERKGAAQRERCELFILYWSDHQARLDDNKIEKIIKAHHDPKLESEAQQFIKPYLHGTGIFSNDNLEKMACTIAADWESMAKKLGFTNDNINEIKLSQPNVLRRNLRMLDLWRLSDTAIQKGTELVKNFHDIAKSAQCGAKLLSMISNSY